MRPPGVPFKDVAAGFNAKTLTQRAVAGQSRESRRQCIDVTGRNEESSSVVFQHFADLIQVRGDDATAHGHVLEELGRRSEKRRAVRIANVRRDEHVTGRKIVGAVLLRGLQAIAAEEGVISAARGRGLMLAFDLPNRELRERFYKGLFEVGLLALRSGERSIRFRPVLDFPAEAVPQAVDMVRQQCRLMRR